MNGKRNAQPRKSVWTLLHEQGNRNRAVRGLPKVPEPPVPGKEVPAHEPAFPPDLAKAASWAEALRGMVDRPFLAGAKYGQQQERADREGAHPDLIEFERLLVKRMAGLGVPMFTHMFIRSAEQQRTEWLEGDSRDSPDDGVWPHKGCAFDMIHSGKGWGLTDEQWLIVGHMGKELARGKFKVRWGGDFKPLKASGLGWDPAHWEIADFRSVVAQYPFPASEPWQPGWRKLWDWTPEHGWRPKALQDGS